MLGFFFMLFGYGESTSVYFLFIFFISLKSPLPFSLCNYLFINKNAKRILVRKKESKSRTTIEF